MIRSRTLSLVAVGLTCSLSLAACDQTGVRTTARAHIGIGYSPYWRYYDRPPAYVPPGPDRPDIELPIEPPPVATPLPSFPEPSFGGGFGGDFGGGFGGDFGGGDIGGADLF